MRMHSGVRCDRCLEIIAPGHVVEVPLGDIALHLHAECRDAIVEAWAIENYEDVVDARQHMARVQALDAYRGD